MYTKVNEIRNSIISFLFFIKPIRASSVFWLILVTIFSLNKSDQTTAAAWISKSCKKIVHDWYLMCMNKYKENH